MSKADKLGRGAAFGQAATARSSRRSAFDSAIRGEDADASAITDLPVTLISDNPDNPRNHLRNLDETVQSIHEIGILLPIVVATTDAYLRDRGDRADDIDDGAQYIVVDGHRRLEAARRVGLATIPVRVDNARVATDESLLEAAFVANYHRDDMTDLEEANALKSLVDYYGSQTKAAKRLGVPQATLSTKLSLLKLSPELQADLVTGARKVEHVRNLGKLTAEEQRQKADERALASEASPRPSQDPETRENHAVIIPEAAHASGGEPEEPHADSQQARGTDTAEPESVATPLPPTEPSTMVRNPGPRVSKPEPARERLPDIVTVGAVPWRDVGAVRATVRHWMTPEDYQSLKKLMLAEDD